MSRWISAKDLPGKLWTDSQDVQALVEGNIPLQYQEEITAVIEYKDTLYFSEDAAPWWNWSQYTTADFWAEDPDIDPEDLYGWESDPSHWSMAGEL